VAKRCRRALAERASELTPGVAGIDGFPGYSARIEDNLLPGITPDLYQSEYGGGAGGELEWAYRNGRMCPPKMHAAHSSAALVVNTFALWKHNLAELVLCGYRQFSSLRFEVKLPTGLGGIPPHVDVLAGTPSHAVVAIESKATEFLQEHPAVFAESYSSARWPACVGSYTAAMRCLQADPVRFLHLDATQLIKHALGLGTRYGAEAVTLLYTFWEPANRDEYPEFDRHSEEVQEFAALVAGSSVRFTWTTYPDLWREWARQDNQWLRQHASKLMERYFVSA
jgi:hypothetical protein